LNIFFSVVFFLLGICFGSFLNVVADRVPAGQSILNPPSHCFKCGHVLVPRDLIPVISYLILKGKCRYCRQSIPLRSWLIELFTGLFFVSAFISYGLSWQMLVTIVSGCFMIVLFITDLEQDLLPHVVVYPGIAVALIIASLAPLTGSTPGIISALTGFTTGFGIFFLIWAVPMVFKRKLMGFGDVGMAGLIGASVGYPVVLIALGIAVLAGGLTSAVLVALKIRKLDQPMQFGLFLSLACVFSLFCGQDIVDALLQLYTLQTGLN